MLVGDYLPFPDVMTQIEHAGFDFGSDRWEHWVRRGLVDRAERIPGTNLYGLPPKKWARLKILIMIDHQLFGRKTPEAVAYFAALWGVDVPPELVAAYMTKGIRTYYGLIRKRFIQVSNRRLDPRLITEDDARKMAALTSADLLKIIDIKHAVKRHFVKQFIDELSFLFICMTYNLLPSRSLGNVLRKIATAIFTLGSVTAAVHILRKILDRERERFVDPSIGNNRIIRDIDETVRDKPDLILRACRDSGIVFAAGQRAFGMDKAPPKRPPGGLKGTARDTVRAYYAILPLTSALFLAFNLDTPHSKFLAELRGTEGATMERQLRRLDRISDWQRRKWEKKI